MTESGAPETPEAAPAHAGARRWWGEFEIPEDHMGRWRVGAMTLWVERRKEDWRLARCESRDQSPAAAEVACPIEPEEPPADAVVERVVGERGEVRLRLVPSLADRSIVARPEIPFRLLPGGEATLYLSVPIWVCVEAPETSQRLLDVPSRRPSDTWFGPSTRVGELCYAVRTKARLHLRNLTVLPDRAIARVDLRNSTTSDLVLERVNLPVHELALYADEDGNLWTQRLTVQSTGGQQVEVDFDDQPPADARGAELVSEARSPAQRSYLLRALNGLVG